MAKYLPLVRLTATMTHRRGKNETLRIEEGAVGRVHLGDLERYPKPTTPEELRDALGDTWVNDVRVRFESDPHWHRVETWHLDVIDNPQSVSFNPVKMQRGRPNKKTVAFLLEEKVAPLVEELSTEALRRLVREAEEEHGPLHDDAAARKVASILFKEHKAALQQAAREAARRFDEPVEEAWAPTSYARVSTALYEHLAGRITQLR